jgi:hypothetical protein
LTRNALQNAYSRLIVISTLHLLIRPVYTSLMSVLLSEGLVYVEIGPLYVLGINGKSTRFTVYHTGASRLNRCFGLLSRLRDVLV